jgi:hypothetical protein
MDVLDDRLAPIGSHRCDRCPQQARARLDTIAGPLYFCGHHTRRLLTAELEAFHTAYEDGPDCA